MDWCGWNSLHGWKRVRYTAPEKDFQDYGDSNDYVEENNNGDSDRGTVDYGR